MPESRPSVAVAIPAYNEAEGIGEFLCELDRELAPAASSLTFVVVDDASKDDTLARVLGLRGQLGSGLVVERNVHNRGHGPTTVRAYRRALDTGAELILQVDGDGQFDGADARVLVESLGTADVATGVRIHRSDPWFRKALALSVRTYLRAAFKVSTRDANCPLRAYRRTALERMLAELPADPMVPNVYLSALAVAGGYEVVHCQVRHRSRRGSVAAGSTWGQRRVSFLVPRRLMMFVADAFEESRRFRPAVRHVQQATRKTAAATRRAPDAAPGLLGLE